MKVKFAKPKELTVKISHYRRTRNVKRSELSEDLRLRMAANGLEFLVTLPEESDDAEAIRNKIERGAYDHTKGLYSIEVEEKDHFDDRADLYMSRLGFDMRFAEHDDLVSFEKNFMLMLKLES